MELLLEIISTLFTIIMAVVGAGTVIVIGVYVVNQLNKNIALNHPWKHLATATNLNFKPGTIFNNKNQIVGNYKGHYLELSVYKRGSGRSATLFTCLSMSLNSGVTKQTKNKAINPQKTLAQFNAISAQSHLKGSITVNRREKKLYYEQKHLEKDIKYLKSLFNLLSDIASVYPDMVALGGETVSTLQPIVSHKNPVLQLFMDYLHQHLLYFVADSLLKDIGRETTKRLGPEADDLFCLNCLIGVSQHKINRISYYGCRNCGQSREFIKVRLIAVLDQTMTVEQIQKADELRVNWLIRRNLFDFDVVEIIQATDEDVERFAVQVGNDTDRYRQAQYKKIACLISANCHLTQNTKRILERTFGKIIEV